ncbi:hypothetical protein SUGI_0644600 [Cryptomeria japonica]|nr:hypothetical protein SUGI_0644600 [Cryptomeria japonica]
MLKRTIMLITGIWALISLSGVFICGAQQSNGNSTNFLFANFSHNNSQQLIYMGDASFSALYHCIDLTPDPNGTRKVYSSNETAANVEHHIGRVLYRRQITMWPASFTTIFTILVKDIASNGDGMAFIIVPDNDSFLAKSYGGFLGLFDHSTEGNRTGQLAIELDTFQNEFDPDDNHVGIDIQSIKSNVTANMGNHGMDIKAGRAIQVRVDYDGWAKSLQIYARYADSTSDYSSLLNSTVELEKIVPRSAYLGFSATTGKSLEIHRLLDWSFSSAMLPESSLNLSPVETGLGTPRGSGDGVKVPVLVGSITVGFVMLGLLACKDSVLECVDPKLDESDYDAEEIRRVLILGLACSHPDPQLRPSMRQAIQVLMNPNEELPQLPSSRPLAIYVVLPPVGAVFSQSTMCGGAASYGLMGESSRGSITASIQHHGR